MTLPLSQTRSQRPASEGGLLIVQQLKAKSQSYKVLLAEVLKWAGRQPLLLQKICQLIVNAPDSPEPGDEAKWLEAIIRRNLIEHWENVPELGHLRGICDRLTRRKQHSFRLLKMYQKLLESHELVADNSLEQHDLQLLGLAVEQQGKIRVQNRIYQAIFDRSWVDQTLKSLQSEVELSDKEVQRSLFELERRLLVTQIDILSRVEGETDDQQSARVLCEALREVTSSIGNLVGCDRVSIFLTNDEKTELWSLVAENETGDFLDIQVPIGEGIVGQVAQIKKLIHIPTNVYTDPRAKLVKVYDQKYHYRTENILALPILNKNRDVIGVIQLLNKLQPHGFFNAYTDADGQQPDRPIDPQGFTRFDLERLARCLVPIRRILESCQSCYKVTKKLRATAALVEATRSIDQISLDTKAILQRVMNTAKKLMNADRSTLWLVDQDRGDLWTELPGKGEVRCPIGVGFVGQVASTQEPMIIPFDLYDHPGAENAKRVDEQTQYRTCSLLCMPVLSPAGELLGVTQLVNKRKSGDYPDYTKQDWPNVPDYFKTSFDKTDQQAMQVFNERVGVVLQFVKTHETLKQLAQVKPKEAIYNALTVLSNAVGDRSNETLFNALYYLQTFISHSIGKLLLAEQVTVFLLDSEAIGFWSLSMESSSAGILKSEKSRDAIEVRISSTAGIASKIIKTKSAQATRNPHKFNDVLIYKGLDSKDLKDIHNLLLFPVLDPQGKVLAIIRLFNKLRPGNSTKPAETRIDPEGFTRRDSDQLQQCTRLLLPILQAFQSFHQEILTIQEQQQALDPLYQAISFISQSSGNSEELIQNVMQAVRELTGADRTSLWLLDAATNQLWTMIQQTDGTWMETHVPMGEGFVGRVAQTGQAVNIPFDLYDHPDSEMARKTDRKTRYRTCSLLCMPVLGTYGELLGVTQLLNKRKTRDVLETAPTDWSYIPDRFRTGFNEKDQRDMEIFNAQVGVILPALRKR